LHFRRWRFRTKFCILEDDDFGQSFAFSKMAISDKVFAPRHRISSDGSGGNGNWHLLKIEKKLTSNCDSAMSRRHPKRRRLGVNPINFYEFVWSATVDANVCNWREMTFFGCKSTHRSKSYTAGLPDGTFKYQKYRFRCAFGRTWKVTFGIFYSHWVYFYGNKVYTFWSFGIFLPCCT
jgi:hypothetical protein